MTHTVVAVAGPERRKSKAKSEVRFYRGSIRVLAYQNGLGFDSAWASYFELRAFSGFRDTAR